MELKKIRQPIVTVAGHVDHGKTSLLDSIRGTSIAKKEHGGITQNISCTRLPSSQIEKIANELLKKFKIELNIPGFLFVDTPGHAAFTNLRKRGGSLADLVILIMDVKDGIMEQTVECINMLKDQKVPFVVAINKIDAIPGWQNHNKGVVENIKSQQEFVRRVFDESFYKIIGKLNELGFDSDMFDRVSDFTKQVPIVPISAKTKEGIPELLVMLSGLSQRFLGSKLELREENPKGTVLEVKKEKGITFIEAIIYDGIIKQGSTIAIGSFDEPIITKIRCIFEARPFGKGFESVKEASAATFLRLQVPLEKEVLPGMPLAGANTEGEIKKAKIELKKEITDSEKLDKEGIVIKADSLGSLEALIFQLKKVGIPISKAGIGDITKSDVLNAGSMPRIEQVILGFNVSIKEEVETNKIKIISSPIIYKLIEELEEWRAIIEKEIIKEKLAVTLPFKIKVLPYVFRKNKPAVFGVLVEEGKLKSGIKVMGIDGKKIDEIKGIQHESKSVNEIESGKEVAISLPNITVGRQVREGDILYSSITSEEYRKLEENKKYLSSSENNVLREIVEIMRKTNPIWGV